MVGSSFWYTHFLIGKRCPPLAASYIQATYNKKGARSNVNPCVCVWWRSNFNICPECIIFSLKIPRSEKKKLYAQCVYAIAAYTACTNPNERVIFSECYGIYRNYSGRNIYKWIYAWYVCRQRAREMLLIKWKYKCICPVAAMLTFIIYETVSRAHWANGFGQCQSN